MTEQSDIFQDSCNKYADEAKAVFFLGNIVKGKQFKYAIAEKYFSHRFIRQILLSLAYHATPQQIRNKMHEKSFEKAPLNIEQNSGIRIPSQVDAGSLHVVYKIAGEDGKHYALSVCKAMFRDTSSALAHAKQQKREQEYYKCMFKEVPELILDESYFVYEKPDKNTSVMFTRDFIQGPIRDIFFIKKNEIEKMLDANPFLDQQLKSFVDVAIKNRLSIEHNQLDILGMNNLSIAGPVGEEKLVFIDPHERGNKTPKMELKIHNRISYLQQIVSERTPQG